MKKKPKKNRKKNIHQRNFYNSAGILLTLIILFNGIIQLLQTPGNLPFFSVKHAAKHYHRFVPGQLYLDMLKRTLSQSDDGRKNGIVFHGDREKKQIALTFDADMTIGMELLLSNKQVNSFYDDKLIEILRQTNTQATLFITGMWAETYPEITRQLADDPLFEIGSHSYAHLGFSAPCYSLPILSDEEKIRDIGSSQFVIEKMINRKIDLFRFPGGCYSLQDISLIKQAGMIPIQWDVVAQDGFNQDANVIFSNVVNRVKNGSIIVMHMNGFPNEPVDYLVVPRIISDLKNKGFEFVTVSQLLQQ